MAWTVETLNPVVDDEIEALPASLRARLLRLMESIERIGPEQLHEPHVKHLEGKLWELRAKAADGIARGIYIAATGRRVVVLHVFLKKSQKTPQRALAVARERIMMTRIAELKKRWMADPEFKREYEKADEEFGLVEALIAARTEAKLSQTELAKRLGTTQSSIARLEGGGVAPSLNTLRRYAEATGMRLKVELVPTK